MTTQKKSRRTRPDLLTAAIQYAFQQSESRAQTAAGRLRAVWTWVGSLARREEGIDETREQSLVRLYLDAQHAEAAREYRQEMTRRESWPKLRKEAAAVPGYVRALLYDDRAPASTRLAWQRIAGELLGPGYRCDRIAEVAFGRAHWGRLRKCYEGENCPKVGIRTETNGKGGWNKVSWHYADYCAIRSRDGRLVWVRYPNGDEYEYVFTPNGTGRIDGKIVRRPEKRSEPTVRPHHLRRYYRAAIRPISGITWVWSREEKAGYYQSADGERYHTEARPSGPAKRHFLVAVQALQKRRAEKVRTAARLVAEERVRTQADRIYVQIEDSIAAGNCPTGTRQFAGLLLTELTGGYPAAVRADVILARRNDNFTRRACVQAALAH